MTGAPPKPEFATNSSVESVADAINAHLRHLRQTWAQPPDLAISSAYFNPAGFLLLADELEQVGHVRMLLGAEPAVPERRIRSLVEGVGPARAARLALRRALDGHARTLETDRDLLGFSVEADTSARRLVGWLRSGRVEVRRLEDAFLHGKAFIVTTHDEGVIAGSSNFTYAGLATNLELNIGQYQPSAVAQVREWFDDLWHRAVPYNLASLYEARFEPHPPYIIYLRMLFERYGAELDQEARDESRGQIHLTTFQRDGLWRAARILHERHGVIIADEVGLGKTFLAGELIRQAVTNRRQRVAVIAPATLRDGPWRRFLATYQLGVECLSFDDLVAGGLMFDPGDYAMVVVDEAHYLRNPATLRADAMRALLSGTPPKDLVLLTATPVNNSLWDLYSLLYYFIKNDAAFADIGIASLRDHFARAMALNPDDLSPAHLFDILDAVAVRRTRPFVKRYYPHDRVRLDGELVPITFPTPRVRKVSYDLDEAFPGFFDRFAHALEGFTTSELPLDPAVLTLARYAPSRYRLDNDVSSHEVQLAGLLRSGLLKRFESSAFAFGQTCRTMAASHDAFLDLLDQGWVATGDVLRQWVATDTDDIEQIAAFREENKDELDLAGEYDSDALRADITSDRDLLLAFAIEAEAVIPDHDPKLTALVNELAAIVAQARAEGVGDEDVRNRRKVLIFSYYADTVEWITRRVTAVLDADPRLGDYWNRITSITGSEGARQEVLFGFAPQSTDAPSARSADLYDIVVTTDVLAEGVNLQQARHIINYDLPWNPMRLVQRHGRIDRIGSRHAEVFLRCFFPDQRLDDLLGLEERLERKLKQAAAAVGVSEVLPGSAANEITFTETRDEIERLQREDATLFEAGGPGASALSGEEYRQELRRALENPALAERIRALPWGSGSGLAREGANSGYVFCARIGDHERVQFRYVEVREPTAPVIVADTLACLAQALCPEGMATERMLDESTYSRAFTAWDIARDDIVVEWNRASDPANLVTPVPAIMHRAADIVRAYKPADMAVDDADWLIDALQAPYPERIQREVRRIVLDDDADVGKVRLLLALARELGLAPSPPPEPLPEITEEDVHLVGWLAIVPAGE
jgi:superfamily II DNA or RNA helicase